MNTIMIMSYAFTGWKTLGGLYRNFHMYGGSQCQSCNSENWKLEIDQNSKRGGDLRQDFQLFRVLLLNKNFEINRTSWK